MKKILSIFFTALSCTVCADFDERFIDLSQAITLAITHNKDLRNHLKKAGIEDKTILNDPKLPINCQQLVSTLVGKIKNKNSLQISEIRSEISREVQDLLLDVKVSYYSCAFLKKTEDFKNKKIEVLTKEIAHLKESSNQQFLSLTLLKQKQKELSKEHYQLNLLKENLAAMQEKLFSIIGMQNVVINLNFDKIEDEPKAIDLNSLKQTAIKMRPDLVALKSQIEEITNLGIKKRLWKITNEEKAQSDSFVFQKQEIEITSPIALIDFKEDTRAQMLGRLKQLEHIYESLWNVALLEVEDAYKHYNEAIEGIRLHQKDNQSPKYQIAQKDLLVSKALLEHATGIEF
jgi:type III secretory pathway component EscV